MKVIGVRRIDISNQQGEYHGYKYYCTDTDENVDGLMTDTFTVSDRLLSSLSRKIDIDDDVLPIYKRDSHVIRTVIFL